jgi:hypothetical protein
MQPVSTIVSPGRFLPFDLVDWLPLHRIFASDSWLFDPRRRLRMQRRRETTGKKEDIA